MAEGGGEDPYLGSEISAAMVKGYQGDDLTDKNTIMACVKHFAAYGAPIAGKEYNNVDMSLSHFANFYMPPYKAAVEAAAAVCKEKKARAIPLAVASAFHTKLMQPAADAFYEAIQGVSFQKPQVRFYSNVLGTELTDFSDMPTLLAKHIVSPVRFTQELAQMQADGADTFIEFGPKAVLTGLVKKTLKDVTAKNCESVDTLKEVMA